MPGGGPALAVAFLPDGRILAAGERGPLVLWDPGLKGTPHRLEGPEVKHHRLIVLPDGQHALTADRDGDVRIWTLPPM
jgi:WD40 repeat protein